MKYNDVEIPDYIPEDCVYAYLTGWYEERWKQAEKRIVELERLLC